MFRILALAFIMLLAGCSSLNYEPKDGLVKIEIEKLVKTEGCNGKGVRAYSARGSSKNHHLESEIFYVSPGDWEIAYYPTYEDLNGGKCEEMEMLIIHGEYTISQEFKIGHSYYIYLNKELVAEVKQKAM